MDEKKRVADYFVVAGLSENPVPLEEFSNEAVLKPTHKQDPIVDIAVINKTLGEQCPPRYKCIETTPSGLPADLNHGSIRSPEIYLCYKRGRHKPPLTDIGVLYEGKEQVKSGCQMVHLTPGGHSANVNNSTSSRIYITYRRAEETAACDSLAVMDICVIMANKGEQAPHAFCQINKTLNRGMVGSDVYLCYKKSMAKANTLTYVPSILGRYPQDDYPNFPLPSQVPLFCLPMGAAIESWPSRAMHPLPVFSTFVLTVGDGAEKVYGAAVTFYEEYPEEKLSDSQRQSLGLVPSSPPKPNETEKTVHHNKSICLLSRWPFFDTFCKFLLYLYRIAISGPHLVPIERYISHFITEVPFPSLQRPRILVQLCQDALSVFQPEESPVPQNGASFITLLKNLGPENCMNLLLHVLMEHKILIHSLRPAVLTSVAEAVASMLFPLHWQCPYIPLCPLGLSDVLSAPTPFIVGVDSRYFDLYDPPQDVTCVDLDTNNVSPCRCEEKNMTYKILPKKPAKVLRVTLEKLYEELCQQNDDMLSPIEVGLEMAPIDSDFQRRQRRMAMELTIQEAFLRFMASVLKGYKNFLLPITKAPTLGTTDTSSLFDIQGFIKSRDKAYHKFFNQMMKTQIFTRFIEERSFVSDKDASLAFFDECTEKVDENKDEPKLIETDDTMKSDRTAFITPPDATGLPEGATYSYNGFPELRPELFLHSPYTGTVPGGKGPRCPNSPMARRTKQEVKSAQRIAMKHVGTPKLWSLCLLGHCYSLWYIHLPAYVNCVHSKTKALRVAYDVLVKMQAAKLQPPDEVCYRVLMQLCGQYQQPVLAVKVLFEMKRNGIHPNAITYGYYNKAVLESKWPSSNSNAYLMWTKLKNVIMSVAQFKRGLKNRRLSMYSNSSSDFDCISQRSVDSFMDETLVEKTEVAKVNGEHVVNDLVSLESPNNEERSSTGGMSDRGYSSMSLDDAKKISNAIGSQDSLDTDTKASIIRKNSSKRAVSGLAHKSVGIRRESKQNTAHSQSIDPKVDECFQKRVNSIVRKDKNGCDSNGNLRGSPYGSAAGLLMTSQPSIEEASFSNLELSQSLNINRPKNKNSRKRHSSSDGLANRRSKSLQHWSPDDPTEKSLANGDVRSPLPSALVATTGPLTNGHEVKGHPLLENLKECATEMRDRGDSAPPELIDIHDPLRGITGGTDNTRTSLTNGETQNLIDFESNCAVSLTSEARVDNSACSTPSHSGSVVSLSPQHSVRTPVTENDPLGLFTLPGQNISQSQNIPKITETTKSPSESVKTVSSKYKLLLDIQPFSNDKWSGSNLDPELANNQNDAASPTSPAKWTPLSQSQSATPSNKANTLPNPERGESPFHKTRLLNRTGSFRSAFRSAAGMLSSKFSELKQSVSTPNRSNTGSSASLSKAGSTDNIIDEDEDEEYMRKAGSLDQLNDKLDRSLSDGTQKDQNGRAKSIKGYLSMDFLDGSTALWRQLQSYALSIPYYFEGTEHEHVEAESPSEAGSSQSHSVLEHLVPVNEVDASSLWSSSSDMKQNSGSVLSLPQRMYDTAMEVEMSSLSRCNGCSSLLYDEEIMAGWSADDSNLNTTCQFCGSTLVPLLQIFVKDFRHVDRANMIHSQSCESMQSIQSMPNVPLHQPADPKGQMSLRKKVLATRSADNILSTTSQDVSMNGTKQVTETQDDLDLSNAKVIGQSFQNDLVNLNFDPSESSTDTQVEPQSKDSGLSETIVDSNGTTDETENEAGKESTVGLGQPASDEADTQSITSVKSLSAVNDKTDGGQRKCKVEPRVSEAIVVPYLSPLVLRKELENVLEQEGDVSLTKHEFVDDHPIIYWNLLWYFKRLDVQSHLPGFVLNAKSTNKDGQPPKSWASADSRHVNVRCVWDNLRMYEDLGPPMYILWGNNDNQSEVVKALVTDPQSYPRSLLQQIVAFVRCNDVSSPIKMIMSERLKQRKANSKAKYRSMYRDMLFLSFVSLGRDNIDHDAFDREYKMAYSALTHRELGRVRVVDRPPNMKVIWCRRMFGELEL